MWIDMRWLEQPRTVMISETIGETYIDKVLQYRVRPDSASVWSDWSTIPTVRGEK